MSKRSNTRRSDVVGDRGSTVSGQRISSSVEEMTARARGAHAGQARVVESCPRHRFGERLVAPMALGHEPTVEGRDDKSTDSSIDRRSDAVEPCGQVIDAARVRVVRSRGSAVPSEGNRVDHPAAAITSPDQALSRVLHHLQAGAEVDGTADWEIVGAHLLALAERDAQDWRGHASEYIGAYVAEVIALFRRRPDTVACASKPWGVAVAKGRLAGRYAVGLEALVGLTGRDEVIHRVRVSRMPCVVSLESLAELEV